ncbi:sulfatase [Sphingobacterium chuzhouense]|uniref:Sulfatase n=1 Tax=Sphingobacterium chuzhouense TaxID=1742264 RepID=A0ABR7XNW9_9SPHI|nr:sulfatase [Sphingobacterium chuzhouense]MBD1420871.1 sulfatase [Sphingobacterium chuzhouense]
MKRLILIALLFCISKVSITYAQETIGKPNVIVIVSDDAGYADFGCYGGKEIPTPNIDALAKSGTLFTDAYVSASVCAPSRAGILTGMYQQRFGFEHNVSKLPVAPYTQEDVGMDIDIKTIGNQMQHNGYHTIALGKWHMGDDARYFPLQRGFDEFYGFVGGHRDFFGYKGQAPSPTQALYDNDKIVPESEVTYLTDMLTDRAVSFVKANAQQPFFMYLAYNAVHTPMNAKQELLDKFSHITNPERRAYAAMMASLDEGVGALVDALKKQNIYDNTLIVFINDNGAATNNSADNGKLRGLKGSKWEGGTRVAYIMQYPNYIPAGKKYHKMVSGLDIMPTAVGAANGQLIAGQITDGKNLLPYINGKIKKAPHSDLFWRRGIAAAVRSGKWKLIRSGDTNPVLLFNLEKDISETKNLANSHQGKVKKLLRKLEAWEKTIEQPRWLSPYGDHNQVMKHRMEMIGREMETQYP